MRSLDKNVSSPGLHAKSLRQNPGRQPGSEEAGGLIRPKLCSGINGKHQRVRHPESCHLGTSPERPEDRWAPWPWLPWEGRQVLRRKQMGGVSIVGVFMVTEETRGANSKRARGECASSEMGLIGQLAIHEGKKTV